MKLSKLGAQAAPYRLSGHLAGFVPPSRGECVRASMSVFGLTVDSVVNIEGWTLRHAITNHG
jgi:hypothetical protein